MKLSHISAATLLALAASASYASEKGVIYPNYLKMLKHASSGCLGIYLTFDDGPIDASMALVEALDASGIKATFLINAFHMYGEGDENELHATAALTKMFTSGHVVANHSYNHMLHNCTDGVESGAAYCNRVGLWPVQSYRSVEQDIQYFYKNIEKVNQQIPNAETYPNNKMTSIARLPYTNGWRVTSR